MNGSRDLYYRKHRTHAWIRGSHKVIKKLVIDSVLFKYVITIVSVMSRKIVVIPTLGVISIKSDYDERSSGHDPSGLLLRMER